MPSKCTVSFGLNFVLSLHASIDFVSVEASQVAGFASQWYWVCRFTYITGNPAATAFRLTSADGLTGTFAPQTPETEGNLQQTRNGLVHGIVNLIPGVEIGPEGITYNGTVTIKQA